MLAANFRMIDQEDVARMDVLLAINFDAVLYGHAKIGEKDRQGALVLRHGPPLVIDDGHAIVLHFVDHHIVGGLFKHRRHLIGGGLECATDDFDGNRIDGHGRTHLHQYRTQTPRSRRASYIASGAGSAAFRPRTAPTATAT